MSESDTLPLFGSSCLFSLPLIFCLSFVDLGLRDADYASHERVELLERGWLGLAGFHDLVASLFAAAEAGP